MCSLTLGLMIRDEALVHGRPDRPDVEGASISSDALAELSGLASSLGSVDSSSKPMNSMPPSSAGSPTTPSCTEQLLLIYLVLCCTQLQMFLTCNDIVQITFEHLLSSYDCVELVLIRI